MIAIPHIIHVDMDAFFVSLEVVRNPKLKGRPVIVGGGPYDRGVVSSASYEARRFGIRSGMPLYTARKLCAQAIFLPVDFAYYRRVAKKVFTVFHSFTPTVEVCSIDEAYLDLSGTDTLWGSPIAAAAQLQLAVARVTGGATCSVGIAPSRVAAKVGSGYKKPNGLTIITDPSSFFAPLPIGDIPGIGYATIPVLHNMGIGTVGDLQRMPEQELVRKFGATRGHHLLALAFGFDSNHIVAEQALPKSISKSTTLENPTQDHNYLLGIVSLFCDRLTSTLQEDGLYAHTVSLTFRLEGFYTFTKQIVMHTASNTYSDIFPIAARLFNRYLPADKRIRLVGIALSNLTNQKPQPDLLSWRGGSAAKKIADSLQIARKKFGKGAVVWGPSFLSPRLRAEQNARLLRGPSFAPFTTTGESR